MSEDFDFAKAFESVDDEYRSRVENGGPGKVVYSHGGHALTALTESGEMWVIEGTMLEPHWVPVRGPCESDRGNKSRNG